MSLAMTELVLAVAFLGVWGLVLSTVMADRMVDVRRRRETLAGHHFATARRESQAESLSPR